MNTNPQAKRILCFGDSLVWGYIPNTNHQRFPAHVRWTGVLQQSLGAGFEVIEEGLNSRGITSGDPRPGKEGRVGMDYIIPCLDTHDPLDYVIVLMGTNELKHANNQTPEQIGELMRTFLTTILHRPSQFRSEQPKVILCAPPTVNDQTDYCQAGGKYIGATEKSKHIGRVFQSLAEELSISFIDFAPLAHPGEDGIHMTAEGHAAVGKAIAVLIGTEENRA